VVTKDRLLVFPSNGPQPQPRLELALDQLRSPAADSLVGGSALLATVNGESVEIVRYTSRRQQRFGRVAKDLEDVAKYHEAVAKGEEVKEEPKLAEDTEELKRCPKCRLLLPQGSKRCPACVHKGRVLLRLGTYLKPYWKQSLILSTMLLATTGLGLISPY